jgi:hypothetical protein
MRWCSSSHRWSFDSVRGQRPRAVWQGPPPLVITPESIDELVTLARLSLDQTHELLRQRG